MDPHPLHPVTEGALLDTLEPRIPRNSLSNSKPGPHRLFSPDLSYPRIYSFSILSLIAISRSSSHYRLRSDITLPGPPIHFFFTCLLYNLVVELVEAS